MGGQPTSGKAALCTVMGLACDSIKEPNGPRGWQHISEPGGSMKYGQNTPHLIRASLVLTNIHTNCDSLSYNMHTVGRVKIIFHLPSPKSKAIGRVSWSSLLPSMAVYHSWMHYPLKNVLVGIFPTKLSPLDYDVQMSLKYYSTVIFFSACIRACKELLRVEFIFWVSHNSYSET